MDQQRPERACGAASAEPRAEWTAPRVDRIVAGGAEGNAGLNVEGQDGLS